MRSVRRACHDTLPWLISVSLGGYVCSSCVPVPEHLAGYVAALERGWSADNERGVEAAREELWSDDSAVAPVTLEERSGPWDIFLFELRDGKVVRSTNLLNKSRWLPARASATTRFLA
jgi:hypothetical protein